jgi:ArsR family transcriptional regulator
VLYLQINMSEENTYSFQFLEAATETLRAIAHPHRLLIVEMLYRKRSMTVTEIYEQLQIEQAVASHNLRILKDRGVVTVRRDGKNSYYALTDDAYFQIIQVLSTLL